MIKCERPPNYDQIVAAFPQAATRHGVLFAYGEDVYNPDGVVIPRALLEHEYTHCSRQFQRTEFWWNRYIDDPFFRYEEELIAHAAELRAVMPAFKDRNARYRMLHATTCRLVSSLYNYVPPRPYKQAMADLSNLI